MAHSGAMGLRLLVLPALSAILTAASPMPSPALSSMLAAPPAGYDEDTESAGTPVGPFDLNSYVQYLSPEDPRSTIDDLRRDGFVSGFGKSWTDQTSGAGFAAMVVAFRGAEGARKWLASIEVSVRKDQYYQGDLTLDGLGPHVGVRYADPSSGAHADVISFVKGNDFFLVGFVSSADMALPATSQAKAQYDFAPALSIPRSQWPENAPAHPPTVLLAAAVALAFLVVLTVVGLAVWLGRRSRLAG